MTTTMPKADVLGVNVSATNLENAAEQIGSWIRSGDRQFVCVTGVHGVMESQDDPGLKEIHNRAGMVTPDGMPMVWMCRLEGFADVSRVYGPDLMLAVCERSVKSGFRHFFYGGNEGVADRLADRLRRRFPGLEVVGTFCPPFRPPSAEEDRDIVDRINASGADIVWVGLSTPKQERWMSEHRGRVSAPVMIGVGAAFDFHSGSKKQAPVWMQRNGLEWFFRLMQEPGRLWKRYLKSNSRFLWLVMTREWLTGKIWRVRRHNRSQHR